jgi:poly(A) polymerase
MLNQDGFVSYNGEFIVNKKELAFIVAKKLKDNGFQAYYAGGCVRDSIMNLEPADYDIATDALPDEVMKIFKKTIPIGAHFGVVLALEEGVPFEITTFRSDGAYVDGRHPESVKFSKTPQDDVKRRDFTINGLLYDPFNDQVLDYVNGVSDIRCGVVRAIGNPVERFTEDKLRLMRAVRFAARFKYEIEENTLTAVKALAPKIVDVSAERIRDEFDKILRGSNPGFGLQMLEDLGVLRCILPEVSDMVGVEQPPEFHPEGDVFIHTKMMLDMLKNPTKVLAFAVLMHDVGKPRTFSRAERIRFDGHVPVGAKMADLICKRFRFSNDEREKVVRYVENHLKFMDVQNMRESKLKRFMQSDTFIEELELHRVDCLASHRKLDNWEFCNRKLEEYSNEEIKPIPLISGSDLISEGYEPGPLFKEILTKVVDLQLENQIKTKEEALTWIKKNYII